MSIEATTTAAIDAVAKVYAESATDWDGLWAAVQEEERVLGVGHEDSVAISEWNDAHYILLGTLEEALLPFGISVAGARDNEALFTVGDEEIFLSSNEADGGGAFTQAQIMSQIDRAIAATLVYREDEGE